MTDTIEIERGGEGDILQKSREREMVFEGVRWIDRAAAAVLSAANETATPVFFLR